MEYGLRRFKSLTVIVGKGLCFIQKTISPFYFFLDIIPIGVICVATVQITMIHTVHTMTYMYKKYTHVLALLINMIKFFSDDLNHVDGEEIKTAHYSIHVLINSLI